VDGSRGQVFARTSIPEGYERFTLRQLFEPWAGELVRRARLQPGWSVLDVSSGLGPVAQLAAAAVGPGGLVVANDISAPMLALAAVMRGITGSIPIGASIRKLAVTGLFYLGSCSSAFRSAFSRA